MPEPEPEPDLAHFNSIPWCRALLRNPSYTITPTFSRQAKDEAEDSLIAETLFSPNTIPHCLSLYRTPTPDAPFTTEVISLLTLSSGMNGAAHVLHGGIIATLIDDVMGTLLTVNKEEQPSGKPLTASTVTAKLAMEYKAPVKTPQTVMVVARVEKMEGRKFWLEGKMLDGGGKLLARGEALWVRIGREGGALKEKERRKERL
jgi:acyl-coenzyme A thioesterase PaaI-like protein